MYGDATLAIASLEVRVKSTDRSPPVPLEHVPSQIYRTVSSKNVLDTILS